MAHEFINVSEINGVMVIRMDDPPTRNAIGTEVAVEIGKLASYDEDASKLA